MRQDAEHAADIGAHELAVLIGRCREREIVGTHFLTLPIIRARAWLADGSQRPFPAWLLNHLTRINKVKHLDCDTKTLIRAGGRARRTTRHDARSERETS